MLDARGLSCPMPVVLTQREVKANSPALLDVLVDNQCAVENVSRYAASQGYGVTVERQGADFLLKLAR